ncbi:undecaprenyl-diphosphatase [Deinococcus metalli]|uniref:Undecaprenyl-diphosphatase n=1 Tax=Deinococcus metalli TaxID=1141878 RepID=A0A7W8NR23_9DEIO|nr:undecaprenyl-diphosphate phosphatase [Deinococcus metalli]MBB5378471.1 undecaprenyl-diphosphatase [Deinococcus metalli]GHF57964.1 undecaprenyl-diphosphatase 2 [Deinococcus metalli]
MTPEFQAVILGVVEGLTEFLPVSSTGHLIVAESLIGYRDTGEVLTVVIQLGAILAVILYYWRQLIGQLTRLLRGSRPARHFWLNLIVASLPAALLGLLFEKAIKAALFSPLTVAISAILGGAVLWWVDTRRREATVELTEPDLDSVTTRQAALIGVAQAVAIIPGVSRSGASIVGGLLTGLNRVTATAFSFFLGIPILGGAGLYSLYKARHALGSIPGGSSTLVIGTVVAFVTALVSVTWLLRYVSTHDFRGFAVYRVVMGAVILALLAAGVLK